jgi:hypothetical protein
MIGGPITVFDDPITEAGFNYCRDEVVSPKFEEGLNANQIFVHRFR